MLWLLWTALAVGADAWKDAPSDIIAETTVEAPVETVNDYLLDLQRYGALFGPECADKWVFGTMTSGAEATARVTYRAGPMRRRATVTYGATQAHVLVEIHHPGRLGFTSQFVLEPLDSSTKVTFATYLDPPPWPFRKVFLFKVRPAWEACHQEALVALDQAVSP